MHRSTADEDGSAAANPEHTGTPGGWPASATVLITGIQGAGKSTVAQLLAERFPRSVHVRGDTFRRMVVSGRAEMSATPSAAALQQLRLRHDLTAATVDAYRDAGFTVIAQDVILGPELTHVIEAIRSRPLLVVVLAPNPEAVAVRERGRGKNAYGTWTIAQLNTALHERTPHRGLWLDTSKQTPDETVTEILRRAPEEAEVGTPADVAAPSGG